MTGFLASLGQKLGERWVAALVLPGAVFEAVVWIAVILGHQHPWDFGLLTSQATSQSRSLDHRPVAQALALIGFLLGALAAGVVSSAVAESVTRCWFMTGPCWLARPLVRWRRHRWSSAHQSYLTATAADDETASDFERRRGELAAKRNAIALALPFRPTWMGDQLDAAITRVHNRYGLDLNAAWPHLWLIIPDHARTTIADARTSLANAATITGWGLMYLTVSVTIFWWPAALIGTATAAIGYRRGRVATLTLAQVCEATADLYGAELAKALSVTLADGQLTQPTGFQITELLRKGT